jgi:uncharacterized protein YjbJ (UPF0337 family)
MKQDTTDADWNKFLERVKDHWHRLTADDLERLGSRDELLAAVKSRYGLRHDVAEKQVCEFEFAFARG